MIIYGHRHYGCTDEIEGLGHVQTRFVHIWFLPLIPFSSTFVVGEDGDGVRGVKVPLSFKSVFSVWTRTAALLGGIAAFGGGVASAFGSVSALNHVVARLQSGKNVTNAAMDLLAVGGAAGGGLCMAVVCAAVYVLVGKVVRKAGRERREEIMALLGFEPDAPATHDPDDGGLDAELV